MIYCPIRENWVSDLPEERVRQRLLSLMMRELGYPKGVLVVEKALSQLPHLQNKPGPYPDRRADILCFAKGKEGLVPALLIECKAVPLTDKVINQVLGYNFHVQARYVAVANEGEVRTGWFDHAKKAYAFVPRLPSYHEL